MAEKLQETAIYPFHSAQKAKLVPFAGFNMPLQYSSLIEEHLCVRERVGLFDVSHMGEFYIEGAGALDFTSKISSNDPAKLLDGQIAYSVFCNEKGGIIDDFLLYRFNQQKFLLVVNAANIEKDFNWLKSQKKEANCQLTNDSQKISQMAIQGPKSAEVLKQLTDSSLDFSYYHFEECAVNGVQAIVSRTGYTGEDGFEIYLDNEQALAVWQKLLEIGEEYGIKPIGLGARDTLRLEMGYALYGNDITEQTTPLEAGLGWVTKIKSHDFVGKEALLQQKERGLSRRLIGFLSKDKLIPRSGYDLQLSGKKVGEVTSGTFSPFLRKGIGLAYLENSALKSPNLALLGRNKRSADIEIVKLPFVRSNVRK